MPAAIGNRSHALAALELQRSGARTGKGFERIGNGASRTAWLHVDTDVVYKVGSWDNGENNEAEYRNARECRKLQWDRVVIPKVSIFRFPSPDKRRKSKVAVLAMEHVKGKMGESIPKGSLMAARKELFDKGGFEDMHGMNFKVVNRKVIPIDMGSTRHGKGWRTPDDRLLTCGGGRNW